MNWLRIAQGQHPQNWWTNVPIHRMSTDVDTDNVNQNLLQPLEGPLSHVLQGRTFGRNVFRQKLEVLLVRTQSEPPEPS